MTKTEDAFRHWVGIGMASAAKREACERGRSDGNKVGQHRSAHCAHCLSKRQIWRMLIYVDGGHDEEDAGGEGKEDDHHQDDVD